METSTLKARSLTETLTNSIAKLQRLLVGAEQRRSKVQSVKQAIPEVMVKFEGVNKGEIEMGLSTGYPELDGYLKGGLKRSEMTIVGARPSVGKTSFVVNIADRVSPKMKVLMISLETTTFSIVGERLIPIRTKISSNDLWAKDGLEENQWDNLYKGVQELSGYNDFYICDQSAGMTIEEV